MDNRCVAAAQPHVPWTSLPCSDDGSNRDADDVDASVASAEDVGARMGARERVTRAGGNYLARFA